MISPRGLRGGRGEAHTLVLVCSSEKTSITSIESLSFTSETLQVCTKVSLGCRGGVVGWGGQSEAVACSLPNKLTMLIRDLGGLGFCYPVTAVSPAALCHLRFESTPTAYLCLRVLTERGLTLFSLVYLTASPLRSCWSPSLNFSTVWHSISFLQLTSLAESIL